MAAIAGCFAPNKSSRAASKLAAPCWTARRPGASHPIGSPAARASPSTKPSSPYEFAIHDLRFTRPRIFLVLVLGILAELQRKGLLRHIGLSNVTATQIAEGRQICDIVEVQNMYNVAHRNDDAMIAALARDRIAYVPFFPLGGFTRLQSSTLSYVASRLGASPMQVALAWLLRRSPNILLIPGTSSVAHLRENLAAAELNLPDEALKALNGIAGGAVAA